MDQQQAEQHPPSSPSIDLEPPSVKAPQIAKPLLLIVQTLYLLLIFMPAIVWSMIVSCFMKPKSLKGKVVLVGVCKEIMAVQMINRTLGNIMFSLYALLVNICVDY